VDTILDKIFARAKDEPDSIAVQYKQAGRWVQVTWREFLGRVEALACALDQLGLKPGDRVTIQSWTRPEWTEVDLAVSMLGAVIVPIYPQLMSEECHYILNHAGVRLVFCEDQEQLDKIERVWSRLPALERAFLFDRSDRSDKSDKSDWSDSLTMIWLSRRRGCGRPGAGINRAGPSSSTRSSTRLPSGR
jgi:long-chain acyl-CoA synthetase